MDAERLVFGAFWALGGFVFGCLITRLLVARELNTYRGIIRQNQQRNIDHMVATREKFNDEAEG